MDMGVNTAIDASARGWEWGKRGFPSSLKVSGVQVTVLLQMKPESTLTLTLLTRPDGNDHDNGSNASERPSSAIQCAREPTCTLLIIPPAKLLISPEPCGHKAAFSDHPT